MSKSSIEESTVYQYIALPVSSNYTVIAHDIVDGISDCTTDDDIWSIYS